MKITNQLRFIIIGIVVFAVGNLGSVWLVSTGKQGTVINQAGLVRGGSQRLVKLELSDKQNDELMQKIDRLIYGLVKGDQELGLPAATNQEFLLKMQEAEKAWNNLKNVIEKTRQNPNPQNKGELLKISEDLFQTTNEAVTAAENWSHSKTKTLKIIKIIVFGFDLIIVVAIMLIVRNLTSTLQKATDNIASSSAEIAATVEQQERTINQQAASVNQTSTTMEELGASSRQAAEQAESSATTASQALNLAETGTKSVQSTMYGIANLRDKVGDIAEQIMRLSEQTGQIAGVSELVADLANQTNMLALNAAVEAARAGEQGKGFSVVASEIRKLADESKKSAEKINSLVTDVQAAMNRSVMVTDEGTKTANESIKLAQGTAEVFTGIVDAANNVFINNQQISLSAKQQVNAIEQALEVMNSVNLGAKETATGIAQVKVSTTQLSKVAEELKSMTQQFLGAEKA